MYASAELLWYLSRSGSVADIAAYAPQYENMSDGYGAYGARIAGNVAGRDLLEQALNVLHEFKDTRQCVVALWRPDDIMQVGIKKDLPCTLSWQLLVRDGVLNMVVNMRSNDVWLGMPYDVYVNTCIQRLMAQSLHLACGTYTHMVGSLHLYNKHEKQCAEALAREDSEPEATPMMSRADDLEHAVTAVRLEQDLRAGKFARIAHLQTDPRFARDLAFSSYLRDAVKLVATKWLPQEKDTTDADR